MKRLLFVLSLLLALPLQAQEYTSRYFHYNQWFDATPPFQIKATTIDGADTNAMLLSGGGAAGTTRGAYLAMYGNENGGVGEFLLGSGDNAGSKVTVATGGIARWTVPQDVTATVSDWVAGIAGTASQIATIRFAYADAADTGLLQLTGGGSSTVAGARGAYMQLQGNDFGGTGKGGDVNIVGGVGNANTAGNYPIVTIRNDTADNSDWGQVNICAGGACGDTRGARLDLYGNENAEVGAWNIIGNAANSSGSLRVGSNSANTVNMRDSANGAFWSFGSTGNAAVSEQFFGRAAQAGTVATIRGTRADGSDDGILQLTAGGAWASNVTRSAGIQITGTDNAASAIIRMYAKSLTMPQWAIGSKPAACDVGAVAIVTDSNDCAAGGGDGALCVCKIADTWSLLANY